MNMKIKNPELSIVICNYNTKKLLRDTLSSIYRYTKNLDFEIIVVDDGSSDKSLIMIKRHFPKVKIHKNNINLGYSKSCNIGTKLAKADYILQLNSDVNFTKYTDMRSLIKFMNEHPNVGICGCKIIKPDGSLDLPCRHALPTIKNSFFQPLGLYKLFPNVKSINYYMTYLGDNEITKVGGLGAFMLLKKSLIKEIGYLDEQFFIYCEDTDYCHRAIKAGWDIYYFPKITVRHMHGGTTNQFKIKALLIFHKGIFSYYKKHYSNQNFFLLNFIVYLGILVRLIIFMIIEFIKTFLIKFHRATQF